MPPKSLIVNRISLIACVIFVLTLFTLHLSLTYAAAPLETAQADYNFQFSKYQDAREKFINAKSNYLTFKTAISKDQAYTASKDYLNQAINLYLAYFALVQEHGNAINWQDQETSGQITKAIAEVKNTYLQSQQAINTSQTLEDVSKNASDLSTKQLTLIDPQLYWILTAYELEKAKNLVGDFNTLAKKLSQNEKSFGSSAILSSWRTDVGLIGTNAKNHLDRASQVIKDTEGRAAETHLQTVIRLTQEAKSELFKSKSLFFEAVKFF